MVAMEAMFLEEVTSQEVDSVAQKAYVVDIKVIWDTETKAIDIM